MITNDLFVNLIEYSPQWENCSENLSFLSLLLEDLASSDLIILPEMFNSGFSLNPTKIAEKMDGRTIKWMIEISLKKHTAICGSLVIEDNGNFYNRFIFVAEGKIVMYYDKRHLFSHGGENQSYTSGNKRVVFSYRGWKICPMICFDLRFPVWFRNTEYYDLLINVANWPDSRIDTWDTLLKARAIENLCYVCGVNRIGSEPTELNYIGHSSIYTPVGKKLNLTNKRNAIYSHIISLDEIKKWRSQYNFLDERDHFKILNE